MKKLLALLLTLCLLVGIMPAALAAGSYNDVPADAWYADEVAYVTEKGFMDGIAAGIFGADTKVSRAMVVTILYRMEGEPDAGISAFTDVPSGEWYTKAVAWAAANGIVEGVSDTEFDPLSNITREQLAAILYRYAAYKGYNVGGRADLSAYADASAISDWALIPMQWAVSAGLINGVTDTALQPTGTADRAQLAAVIYRFNTEVVPAPDTDPDEDTGSSGGSTGGGSTGGGSTGGGSIGGGTVTEHECRYSGVAIKDENDVVIGTRYTCNCGDTYDVIDEGAVVAQIDDTYYTTLDGALDAAVAGDTIDVKGGTYTLPATIPDDIVIVGADELTFNLTQSEGDWYRINTNGTTFKNVKFEESVTLTGSANFEDCTFVKGTDTWTINGDTSLVNCTVADNGDGTTPGFSLHIDSGSGTGVVTVENAEFTGGAVAFKGIDSISFTGCEFAGTYGWKYMRAYVPTTLTDCTFTATTSSGTLATVKAVEAAFNAVTRVNTDVVVEYALPATVADDAVIGSEGNKTVVTLSQSEGDWYRINTNGATFIGVEFSQAVCLTGSASFEDCVFGAGLDTCTINEDTTFTGCTFADNGKGFAFHIDGGSGDGVVTVDTCEFTDGAVAFKGIDSISFTGCEFAGAYGWKYMRAYVPTTLTDCTFTATTSSGTLATVKAVEGAVDNVTLVDTTVTIE